VPSDLVRILFSRSRRPAKAGRGEARPAGGATGAVLNRANLIGQGVALVLNRSSGPAATPWHVETSVDLDALVAEPTTNA